MDNKNLELFVTCLADTFYPDAATATVNVLEKLGYTITYPAGQTCCGQPMYNAGYFDQSREVARHTVSVFLESDKPIIVPSSSCAAMIRHRLPRTFQRRTRLARKSKTGFKTYFRVLRISR